MSTETEIVLKKKERAQRWAYREFYRRYPEYPRFVISDIHSSIKEEHTYLEENGLPSFFKQMELERLIHDVLMVEYYWDGQDWSRFDDWPVLDVG